jgi:hypothetical protein
MNGIPGSTLAIGNNLTTETIQIGNTGTTTLIGSVTASTLGVTGVTTATGGVLSPIPTSMTYTTLPNFTSQQIGYSIKSVLVVSTNVAATTVSHNPFSATTFSLTPGVWLLNVQLRIRASSTGTVTITKMLLNHTLATAQSGFTNNYCLIENQKSIVISDYAINSSCIIVNNTASNVLTPAYVFTYTTTTRFLYRTDTFLIITRIT